MSLNEQLGATPGRGRRGARILVVLLVLVMCAGAVAALVILRGARAVSGQGSAAAPVRPGPGTRGHAALAAINLQPSEMAGWTMTPHHQLKHSAALGAADRQMLHCLGLGHLARHQVATAHSPDYALGDMQANSSVTRYRSHRDVRAEIAAFHKPKAQRCIARSWRKAAPTLPLPAGVHLARADARLSPAPRHAPRNVAGVLTAMLAVEGNGRQVNVYVTDTLIFGRRIDADVAVTTTGTPVSPRLQATLVNRVAARAEKF